MITKRAKQVAAQKQAVVSERRLQDDSLITLKTNRPEFYKDLMDIVTLFNNEVKADFAVEYNFDQNDKREPRFLKRDAKNHIYQILSKKYKVRMPWGSLTGVHAVKFAKDLKAREGFTCLEKELHKRFFVSPKKAKLITEIINVQNQAIFIYHNKLVHFYVHIPICPSRCKYCSFISAEYKAVQNKIDDYVDALVYEIQQTKALLQKEEYDVKTIYMGGGTPSVLSVFQLEKILKELSFDVCEFTVECGRPETVTPEKLALLKQYGVTRISINPQTFCNQTLQAMGRKHTAEDVLKAYQMAKDYGFVINMDLLCGLSGEKLATFKNTLRKTIALKPANISVHSLALKRGSAWIDEASGMATETEKMIEYAHKNLHKTGYLPYYLYRLKNTHKGLENVGYTKPGSICRFNIDSMDDEASIIAVGAGGISKKIDYKQGTAVRCENPKDLNTYIEKHKTLAAKKFMLF